MENFRICSSSLEVKMSIHMLETIINSDIQMDIMNKMFSYIYTSSLYQLSFLWNTIFWVYKQKKDVQLLIVATRQTIYLRAAPWENASTYKGVSEAFSPTQRSNRKQSEQKQVPRGRASASTASEYTQQGNSKRRGLCVILCKYYCVDMRHVK